VDGFAAAVGRWFAEDAHLPHPSPVGADPVTYRRQMSMALALAASKRLELGEGDAFRAWIDATEARAETRGAAARVEAMRLARSWLS